MDENRLPGEWFRDTKCLNLLKHRLIDNHFKEKYTPGLDVLARDKVKNKTVHALSQNMTNLSSTL
jgi:hypothetical protein